MATTTIRVLTSARYRGLPVTVLGTARGPLLAIAAYGTPQELAIAAVAVKRQGARRVFSVAGAPRWTADVSVAAAIAAAAREARDVDELGAGPDAS